RHEGPTTAVSVPAAAEVLAGLRDGTWLATDEVKGPDDREWRPIEAHPAFEEAAADLEEPPSEHPDETHLDMNPLIDVCLVLLIFFILTTSYVALQQVLDMPTAKVDQKAPLTISKDQVDKVMIRVEARQENGHPVIKVEDKVVDA